jgi:hypothetical protein
VAAIFRVLLRFPGLVLNLVFLAYFAFLQPALLNRLLLVIERGAVDPLLSAAFLIAPFLELAGFYFLVPGLVERLAQAPRQLTSLPVLVWMAHLVLTLVLMLNGFACLQLEAADNPPLLGVIYLAAVVIKELFYLLYWIMQADPERLARSSVRWQALHHPHRLSQEKQLLAGLLLVPFSTLSFTGFWGLLIARSPIHWSSPGDAAVELALAVFVFLVVFAASRGIYLIEELSFLQGRLPWLVWVAGMAINLGLAIVGLPGA